MQRVFTLCVLADVIRLREVDGSSDANRQTGGDIFAQGVHNAVVLELMSS